VATFDKGCLVNSLYNYPTNLNFFTTPELLEIGNIPMTASREKPTRGEGLKYYRRVTSHYKLDVRQYETVDSITGDDGAFVIETTKRTGVQHRYSARKLILATGFSSHGFAMGPVVGKLIAELAGGGRPSLNLSPFRFERFAEGTGLGPRNTV